MLSIPRDLRVTIPGQGIAKINDAYGFGGLDLTARTVKDLLSSAERRFRINHAIAVDFAGFREAVDVVNCVYVDVDRRYYHSNLGLPVSQHYAEIDVSPGTSGCAARMRSTTCASATTTTTSCAPPASRTSCARRRPR